MSFSLLAPGALLLSALTALAVAAHLTRQRPTERVAFGAMLLVQRLVKRLRRRRSIKDQVLLAMRIAAVLLAVLAAAGPRLSWFGVVPDFGGSGRIVIVIDASMSMSLSETGNTLLARARAEAANRVRATPDGVRFGVVSYDAVAHPLTPELTDDKAHVLALIDGVEPTNRPGDLGAALLEARRLLGGEAGEVLLFSDEAGPSMIPNAEDELARIVEAGSAVVPVPVLADPPRNVTVSQAEHGDGIEGGQVVFRVMNYGPDPLEVPCEVILPDGARIAVFVDAPPEAEAESRVTVPREAAGGVGRVHCDDEDLALDDTRWFHMPQVGASRVMVVDGDPGDTPTRSEVYFLERALAPWGGLRSGVTPDVISPAGLSRLDRETHRLLFLANLSDPRPFASRIRDFVRRGGNVVITMGSNVTPERYNAALGAILPAPFRRAQAIADRGEEPVPLQLPDTTLPLFEPFARAGRSAFRDVGAWRVMTLEPYQDGGEVRTLLRFEGGVPALVERRVGKGRVLVWTSTVDDGWSNLPFQAVFMPMVQRLAVMLGGDTTGELLRVDARVGERVEVSIDGSPNDTEVRGPDGELVTSHPEGGRVVFTPRELGAYQVSLRDGPALAWVAVNIDPLESDVRRTHSVAETEADIEPELFTQHTDLGGAALWLSLMMLVASAVVSWLGGTA